MNLYLVTAVAPKNAEVFIAIIAEKDASDAVLMLQNYTPFVTERSYIYNKYVYSAHIISIPRLATMLIPAGLFVFTTTRGPNRES